MINNTVAFRGKSEETGAWVCGFLYILGKGTKNEEYYILGNLDHRESIYDLWKCATRVIKETVGQYSGAKDRNGKRIFGGDIVYLDDVPGFIEKKYYEVKYGYGQFFIGINTPVAGYKATMSEVVGNIWDNSELLDNAK